MRRIFKMLMRLDILQKRIRRLEVAEKIDAAIEEYYTKKGIPVPRWKMQKNPEWWTQYLVGLGMDPNNP